MNNKPGFFKQVLYFGGFIGGAMIGTIGVNVLLRKLRGSRIIYL